MDEYAYLLKFVPNDNSARFLHYHSESVLLWFIQINMWIYYKSPSNSSKLKRCFSKQLKLSRCVRIRGHRTWRRGFPTVDVLETCIYLCHLDEIDSCHYLRCCIITCLTSLILSWLFATRTQQKKKKLYKCSTREIVMSSHATRLTWGCTMTFSNTRSWCENPFPICKNSAVCVK